MAQPKEALDTALILAGGVGSRDLPMSKLNPKEMAEVYGLPLIDRVVADLAETGIKNFVVVVSEDDDSFGQNYQMKQHERWFGPSPRLEKYLTSNGKAELLNKLDQTHGGIEITHVVQPAEGKYGTAVPLFLAQRALDGSGKFIVVNGDDLLLTHDGSSAFGTFIDDVNASGAANGVMGRRVARQTTGKYPYGILMYNEQGRLSEIAEKPDAVSVIGEPLMNTGKFIFDESTVFAALNEYMGYTKEKRGQDEYYLTTVAEMAGDMHVHITDAEFVDAGDRNLRLIASMMMAGLSEDLILGAKKHFWPEKFNS